MSRKRDLEENIRQSYNFIRDFEEQWRLSVDPLEKARARRAIEEQWGLIEGYLEEYMALCSALGAVIPPDVHEIAVACRVRKGEPPPSTPPTAKPGVVIGGNVNNSVIITGDGNVVGRGEKPVTFPSRAADAMAVPSPSLVLAILRIYAADGETVVGAGFLVGTRMALTCDHVVRRAIVPTPAQQSTSSPGGGVKVDFPLLAPNSLFLARVVRRDARADVAVLELAGELPAGAVPVTLKKGGDLWNHPFRAFGFPPEYTEGVWAAGRIRGPNAQGWLQIEDTTETGYRVQPGFSGSPVWDEVLGGVVGMVVATERAPEVRAAFIIPADRLPVQL